jgi:hypothetical protein
LSALSWKRKDGNKLESTGSEILEFNFWVRSGAYLPFSLGSNPLLQKGIQDIFLFVFYRLLLVLNVLAHLN